MALVWIENTSALKMLHTAPPNIKFSVIILHGAQSAPLDDLSGAKSVAYNPIHIPMMEFIQDLGGMIVIPNSPTRPNGQQYWKPLDAANVHSTINEAAGWGTTGKVIVLGGSSGAMMAHRIGMMGNPNVSCVGMVDMVSSYQFTEDLALPNLFVLGDSALNLDLDETPYWNGITGPNEGLNPFTVNAFDDSLLPYNMKMTNATSIQRLTHSINITTIGDHDGSAWVNARPEINYIIQSIYFNVMRN